MRHTTAIALLGLALGTRDARSQQSLPAGQRVRITSAQYRLNLKVATLIAMDDSTIRVAVTRYLTVNPRDPAVTDTVALSRAGIDRLEVSRSRTRGTGKGALIGLASGAVVGGIIGATSFKECTPNPFGPGCASSPSSRGQHAVIGAMTLGLVGAGIGALIGSASHGDHWEPVLPVRPLPHGGIGLGLGIRF